MIQNLEFNFIIYPLGEKRVRYDVFLGVTIEMHIPDTSPNLTACDLVLLDPGFHLEDINTRSI